MSQTSESGTVQVRRFAPPSETGAYTTMLVLAAVGLLTALLFVSFELYQYYDYILVFKTGG